jgi:hypothetical protein
LARERPPPDPSSGARPVAFFDTTSLYFEGDGGTTTCISREVTAGVTPADENNGVRSTNRWRLR